MHEVNSCLEKPENVKDEYNFTTGIPLLVIMKQ